MTEVQTSRKKQTLTTVLYYRSSKLTDAQSLLTAGKCIPVSTKANGLNPLGKFPIVIVLRGIWWSIRKVKKKKQILIANLNKKTNEIL